MQTLFVLLRQALALNASDLFITATKQPYFRVKGLVTPLEDPTPIPEEEVSAFRQTILGEKNEASYQRKGTHDISYMLSKTERFRLNFYATLQGSAFVARPLCMGGQLYPEALHLAEELRLNAREIKWHVGRLRGASQTGHLQEQFPAYAQRAVATYYLMTRSLLVLYEGVKLPEFAELQEAI